MKPCPFCAATDVYPLTEKIESMTHPTETVVIACGHCGAHGPTAGIKEDAERYWDEREEPMFKIADDGSYITCLRCGLTSHNPNDIKNKYCGNCHEYHGYRSI